MNPTTAPKVVIDSIYTPLICDLSTLRLFASCAGTTTIKTVKTHFCLPILRARSIVAPDYEGDDNNRRQWHLVIICLISTARDSIGLRISECHPTHPHYPPLLLRCTLSIEDNAAT